MGCNAWYVIANDGYKMPGHSANVWPLLKPVDLQICEQAGKLNTLWAKWEDRGGNQGNRLLLDAFTCLHRVIHGNYVISHVISKTYY